MNTLLRLATVTLMFLVWAVNAFGQGLPAPTIKVEGDLFADSRFNDPSEPSLDRRASEVGTASFLASASYPVIRRQGADIYFIEASFRQRRFAQHSWPDGVSRDPDRLQEVNLSLTYRTTFSQRWAAILNVSPQLASDFSDNKVRSKDFKLQGAVILERTFSERWTVGFGAAYATTFGQPFPLPLLTFRFESGGRWSASGNLPASAEVGYRISQGMVTGFLLAAEGGQYHIPNVYPASMNIDNPQVQYVLLTAGPTLELRPNDRLAIIMKGGLAYQGIRLYDGTDEIPNSDYDLKPNAFVRVGVELSL